ncbi:MAG TPA: tetratricopeptide repeat protein [Burkholderiaceae bacterium]|nr:tetratricopeptide repeat protein [Burkholderiaceae bacterium]
MRALVDARLLVSEHSTEFAREEPGFRVAHEALLRRWPRVTDWIAQHRQDLQTRARLRQQVQRWEQGGRAAEFLWPRGRQLLEGVAVRRSAGLRLGESEMAFLAACERRAALGGRLRLGVFVVLTVLAVTASWVAWRNQQLVQAVQEKRRSSQGLVSMVLGQVLEQLRPSTKLSIIESVGQQALQVLGEEEQGLSPAERLQRAKALLVIGESSWGRRQVAQAQEALLKAYAILGAGRPAELLGEWATAEGATAYWLWELARAGHGVGRSADDWLLAYRRAIEAWVVAEPTSRAAWVEMGNAIGNQGVAAADVGDWSHAQRFLDEAIGWKQRALEGRDPDPQMTLDLVSFIQQYANVLQAQGQYAEALRHSGRALDHLRALAALTTGEPLSMDRLARALRQRARLLLDMRRDEEGSQALAEALELARRTAARDGENVNWVSNRWWTEVEWLNYKATRAPGISLQAVDEVIQPLQAWLAGSKVSQDLVRRGEALVAGLQARHAWQQGELMRARQEAESSRQGWLERWQGKPFNPYLQQQLAGSELLLLQILSRQGDRDIQPLCRDIAGRLPRLEQAGGAVREVALLAQRCLSGRTSPEPAQDQQLRAGGYVPSLLWTHFPTDTSKR